MLTKNENEAKNALGKHSWKRSAIFIQTTLLLPTLFFWQTVFTPSPLLWILWLLHIQNTIRFTWVGNLHPWIRGGNAPVNIQDSRRLFFKKRPDGKIREMQVCSYKGICLIPREVKECPPPGKRKEIVMQIRRSPLCKSPDIKVFSVHSTICSILICIGFLHHDRRSFSLLNE